MWTTQVQFRPHIPVSSSPVLSPLISARRTPADQADKIGGLGLDILTTYKPKPDAVRPLMIANKEPNQIQRQEEEGPRLGTSQLRGSDVLLALQQAATRRRRRRKENKSSSSSSSSGAAGSKSKSKKGATWFGGIDDDDDDDVEENEHVRSSLMIKSDWWKRIEDLERRLQELSEF